MAALLIALDSPVTVLLGPAGTATVVPLIVIVLVAVRELGASVPCTVGHAVFQSSLPTNTHWL